MMCPMHRGDFHLPCIKKECRETGMCVLAADPPTRERKEGMKDQASRQIAVWYSAPAEALERDLNTLKLFEPLTQEERDELIAVGEAILTAKNAIEPPKPKRGRPVGSKAKKEGGNGE